MIFNKLRDARPIGILIGSSQTGSWRGALKARQRVCPAQLFPLCGRSYRIPKPHPLGADAFKTSKSLCQWERTSIKGLTDDPNQVLKLLHYKFALFLNSPIGLQIRRQKIVRLRWTSKTIGLRGPVPPFKWFSIRFPKRNTRQIPKSRLLRRKNLF